MEMTGQFDDIQFEERVFAASDDALSDLSEWVEEALENADSDMKATMQILIAMEEIFVNIAHYAYGENTGEAKVGLALQGGKCILQFTDSGVPFDPLEKEDPDLSLEAQERSIGGLGIYMVKKSMDRVSYQRCDGNNVLTIVKAIGEG